MPTSSSLSAPATHRELLDNGMVLLLQEDHTAPLLTLQAWFRAGSIHEHELLGCGMSHFVEHMLFKGTPRRGVGQFARDIAAAGGDLNAYTNYDRTVYHVHVRSEYLEPALDALADVVQNSSFDPGETAKEQEVIVNELKSYLDHPDRVLHDLFHSTLYKVHPFRFPIGGLVDQFRRLTREDLLAYYRKVYVPNNAVFVAVGNFSIAEALPTFRAAWQGWARRPLASIYVPQEPLQTGPRYAEREFRTRVAKLVLGWHTIPITHPDLYALDLMASILGNGDASRLARVVRDEKGLVHDIDAGNHTPCEPGYFYVSANLETEKLDAARAAAHAEVLRFAAEPVTEEELARAKNKVTADFYYQRQTIEGQANALGTSELMTGGADFDRVYVAGIQRTTAEEIRAVAAHYFIPANLSVAVLKPLAEKPAAGGNGGAAAATAGAGGGAAAAASALAPRAGQFTLPNGATVCVVENHKLPIVSLYAGFLGGSRFEAPETNGVCNLMARLLTRGTTHASAEEIARRIESVGGRIDPVSGKNSFGVRVTAMRKDLGLALEVLADCLAAPAFPEKELEQARQETLAHIRARTDQVWDANAILFNRLFYGTHPYSLYQYGTLESVAALGRERLTEFHARYAVPGNLALAVVGDVTPGEIEGEVRRVFGALPVRPLRLPEIPAAAAPATAVKEVRDLPDKNLAAVIWGFRTVAMGHPDRWTLDVLQNILSNMGGRLFVHLRDEQALAYSVGSFSAVQLEPGYFAFYIVTQPQNLEAAVAALRGEIETLKRDGVTDLELATAKNAVVGQAIGDWQTNEAQAATVALDHLYGLGYLDHYRFPGRVEAVTREGILSAARQYFDLERSVLAITRPTPATAEGSGAGPGRG
ncbi:MAG: insulinase family protein [Planctomycetes bacterium]|nr:insulinase family protein [Planctomycetota bacterium]